MKMADQGNTTSGRGGSTGLAMMVGALAVAVLVIGFFVFGGSVGDGEKDVNIKVQTPDIGGSSSSGDSGGNSGAGNQGGGQTQ
jgi:hypothetical protein